MYATSRASVMRHYRDSSNAAVLCDASPHRLIAMLYDGALERLAHGVDAIEKNDVTGKLRSVQSAMAIIEYLRAILDHAAGGELSRRLEMLYDYMLRRLLSANSSNDPAALREVMQLLMTVKSGWDGIVTTPEAAAA